MDELKLMLPELNQLQFKWLQTYIAVEVLKAEKRGFKKGYAILQQGASDHE